MSRDSAIEPSIEGMWTVSFDAVTGSGSGIIVFETGRVFGGDSQWYYLGNYEVDRHEFQATVETTHYGWPMDPVTAKTVGNSPVTIDMSGRRVDAETIEAQGRARGYEILLNFKIKKVADLP